MQHSEQKSEGISPSNLLLKSPSLHHNPHVKFEARKQIIRETHNFLPFKLLLKIKLFRDLTHEQFYFLHVFSLAWLIYAVSIVCSARPVSS
jgi:hypothetical protein